MMRALFLLALAAPALAQNAPAPDPRADLTQDESLPLGWLSDPDVAPADAMEALTRGKINLNDRFRVEIADTSIARSASAITNRLRLGYMTKPYHGFSVYAEMENVTAFNEDDYFVPAIPEGDPGRTVIADPEGTELNQLYARFSTDSLDESDVSLDVRAGRQRILLDDQRFVGAVGWRQFEQTYDAVRLTSNLGVEDLTVNYAYVWNVERIFGPDGPSSESDTHLANATYAFAPEIAATAFAYLLDFESDEPLNSSHTYGVRLTGTLGADEEDEEDVFLAYELTYARQTDAGENPVDFDADFLGAQATLTRKYWGSAMLGYHLLGSDDGAYGFRFPLGTNHKFQGFADNFLTTPANGLQDLYAGVSAELPWGVRGSATAHWFWTDEGGRDLGSEIDLVLSKKINPNWTVLIKGAHFDGSGGQPDISRAWFQTEFRF